MRGARSQCRAASLLLARRRALLGSPLGGPAAAARAPLGLLRLGLAPERVPARDLLGPGDGLARKGHLEPSSQLGLLVALSGLLPLLQLLEVLGLEANATAAKK